MQHLLTLDKVTSRLSFYLSRGWYIVTAFHFSLKMKQTHLNRRRYKLVDGGNAADAIPVGGTSQPLIDLRTGRVIWSREIRDLKVEYRCDKRSGIRFNEERQGKALRAENQVPSQFRESLERVICLCMTKILKIVELYFGETYFHL